MKSIKLIRNQRGQSLIEYLLLVALMAVGTIGVLRVLNKTVQVNFANVTAALQGESRVAEHEKVETTDFKKRDMGDFMSGAAAAKNR
ncbi:MAG: hypothetical protein AABZ31_05610 [Bdellovibrionota bacterium]|mgnify:CR=1 FL=1